MVGLVQYKFWPLTMFLWSHICCQGNCVLVAREIITEPSKVASLANWVVVGFDIVIIAFLTQ